MNSQSKFPDQIVIKFDHVTKKFSQLSQKTFKEFIPALIRGEQTTESFTALNNISFEIERGETVGIIGPNGSGKSTILKLIAGVMSPNSGTITVKGKISPLIELGAGFHPELTGSENIYLNGAILGLKRKEIDKNFQSIVDFAELQEFINQPIKHYSSGMYMRLAFAVAIHVHPEILIVDEILSVGDQAFQEKCFAKMEEFKKSKDVTIIFVSHSLDQVEKFCTRALYLNEHQIQFDGKVKKAIEKYEKTSN
ncbi:MAG: ABC transporter ATP-binding protein [Candidatus Shapirobacteria bacterium]|jgi:ABC-2 type transport system ATP-binding protein/lipopolysaccharide transport system ATP-binding protein